MALDNKEVMELMLHDNDKIRHRTNGQVGVVTHSSIYDNIDGQLVTVLFSNLRRGLYAASDIEKGEE